MRIKHLLLAFSCCLAFLCSSLGFAEGHHDSISCPRCGTVPYPTDYNTPQPITDSPEVWSFVSAPELHPMKITVNKFDKKHTSPGFIFLAPFAFSDTASIGQQGSLIMDSEGIPFWFRPTTTPNLMNNDFRVQELYGKPVLTFWQGTLVTPPAYTNLPGGSSEPGSCFYILDDSYQVIHTVKAKRGFISDIHEFKITPRNTVFFLSTKTIPMDLTPYGGPQDGYVQDFAIQEIDLKTNELVFFWDAIDHIPFSESYEPVPDDSSSNNIWDVYHLNSIGLTDNKHEIIFSSRSTWTIYKINKHTGDIIWQLGGKHSSFEIEAGGEFSWQHDARMLSSNLVSLFNDNSDGTTSGEAPSHGLILELNFEHMTASKHRSYFHNPNITVASQGNLQSLKNGNKFVGWGQSQYFSEFKNKGNNQFDPAKNLVYDAQMPASNYSYRAYRDKWVGKPHYPPSVAVREEGAKRVVYASWNGATEVRSWEVFAGHSPKKLKKVKSARKAGFETDVKVSAKGPYYQVKALDGEGNVIGSSVVVKYRGAR